MTLSALIALFICLPLVELALLLKIGEHIGWMSTLGLIVVTGIVGAFLAKREGRQAWVDIHRDMAAGQIPGMALIDGVMILAAGVMLLTPGLITDAAGFMLLTPPGRRWVRRWLSRRFEAKASDGIIDVAWEEEVEEMDDGQ